MPNELRSLKLDTELWHYIKDHVYFYKDGIVYPDQSFVMPASYKHVEESILNLEVFPDDIWVISYLKTGTTWTQEMVWLLVNNIDFENAKVDLNVRFPFLEYPGLGEEAMAVINVPLNNPLQHVRNLKRPRLIKSHLPFDLLPHQLWEVKPKIIYVMREPKDVALSYYNHYLIFNGYTGTKEKFFEAFTSDLVNWGSIWRNFAPFWKMRHQPNILVNTFEEMKNDLAAVVGRTAKFLDKIIPESKLNELLVHLSFSSMKDNEFTNLQNLIELKKKIHGFSQERCFMDSGKSGNYREKMSPEWIQRFDDWDRQEKIKYGLNTDLDFPY